MRHLSTAVLLSVLVATSASAQSAVFVVRHAERADSGAGQTMMASDPDLSAAGHARAQSLARLLANVKLTAIFTTEYRRTRQTAELLATALGIQPVTIPSKDTATLVGRLKSSKGHVLVVGHSNTVPAILEELGIADPVTVDEQEFDNLFIVVRGSPPTLLHLHYR